MLTVLGVSLLSSCAEFKAFGDEMFEESVTVPNAVVTHASPVKYRESVKSSAQGLGFEPKGKTWSSEALSSDSSYQTIRVSGGGYNVQGDVTYDGINKITTGQKGILKVGKNTKKFKEFEPSL